MGITFFTPHIYSLDKIVKHWIIDDYNNILKMYMIYLYYNIHEDIYQHLLLCNKTVYIYIGVPCTYVYIHIPKYQYNMYNLIDNILIKNIIAYNIYICVCVHLHWM